MEMAATVLAELSCSGRAVCRWLSLCRGTLIYQPKPLPKARAKDCADILGTSVAGRQEDEAQSSGAKLKQE
jgi:hypothetical protein